MFVLETAEGRGPRRVALAEIDAGEGAGECAAGRVQSSGRYVVVSENSILLIRRNIHRDGAMNRTIDQLSLSSDHHNSTILHFTGFHRIKVVLTGLAGVTWRLLAIRLSDQRYSNSRRRAASSKGNSTIVQPIFASTPMNTFCSGRTAATFF